MKINILAFTLILISGFAFGQNKMEKCNKLEQTEQKLCKDNVITHIISDYVEYPQTAKENFNEGTVYVRFVTDENQNLKSLRVLGESNENLAAAAQKAIEKFADAEGKMMLAQSEVYRIPVKFELE